MPRVEETELVGKIQDISDVLVVANAAEMPFVTMVRKGKKPQNTLVEWPIDKYEAASNEGVPFNKDVESFVNTQENRELLHGRVMRQWRNPMVDTAAQEITKQAGDEDDKFAQSRAKTTVELKQDMEYTCLGRQDSRPQANNLAARTRGLACWTNAALQTEDTVTVVPAAFRPAAGQIYTGTYANWWEDDFRAQLQARYETVRSKGDLTMFAGTDIKSRFSDFTKLADVTGGKTLARLYSPTAVDVIIDCVELYKGDYGNVKCIPDLFTHDSKSAEIADMNLLEIRPTLLPRFRELEDQGGGRRGINETIYCLVNKNPQGHCTVQST